MSLLLIKLITIVVIFASGVIGGLLPRVIGKAKRGNEFLMLGSAFSGGVFLGAGLIHLLGDGLELMDQFVSHAEFPWAFFILGVGFLMILFIEKVLSRSEEAAAATAKQPYILLLILSIHSVVAGTAFGLETSIAGSLILLFAIIAHKSFAGFALGVSFHDANIDPVKARNLIIFFSLSTPFGALVGTLLSSILQNEAVIAAEAIFDSLAAGTFIYVATLDILKESFESHEKRAPKFLFVAMGFLLMALLAFWV